MARGWAATHAGDRTMLARLVLLLLCGVLALAIVASLAIGASGASLWGALAALMRGDALDTADRIILWDIRGPRTVMGALVGAALAVSGATMQGLFRNPLADPGLIGISAGAGLGAITAIVLGGLLPVGIQELTGNWTISVAAFFSGWVTTMLLYRVSTRGGRTNVAVMLLAGIALGALAGALSGLLVFKADDAQLRDLTFWGLGSLAGATWAKTIAAAPFILATLAVAPFIAKGLNGLALGEASAGHLGIPVQRMKTISVLAVAGAVGAAVAVSGGIGFVGIVVPHLLRLAIGPDHRFLLPASALLGAALLLSADIVARIIVAPAELPIGIVMAIIGGPFFLWLLLRNRSLLEG